MPAEDKTFSDREEYRPAEEIRAGFETYDDRFAAMLPEGAQLEHHWTGAEWSEGPVYFSDGDYVIWSDIPNDRMLKFSKSTGDTEVFREPANYTNGHYRDRQGRLVSCEHGRRCISRTEHDGTINVLVDRYEGKRLNSPNDLVVKSDGTIWFSDPPYGIESDREGHASARELGANYLFTYDPETKELSLASDALDRPNGLCFSPDESILYVADSGQPRNMVAFDVGDDGRTLANMRVFITVRPGIADGFRVDTDGNIFTSAWEGIQVYSPAAELLGKILVPEQRVANCVFGDPDKRRLYIAGDRSLYSIRLNVTGAQTP